MRGIVSNVVLLMASLVISGCEIDRSHNTNVMVVEGTENLKVTGMTSWKNVAILPQSVGGACASLYHEGLIVAGGSYWLQEQKFYNNKALQLTDNDKWKELSSLPTPSAYGAALVLGNGEFMWFGGIQVKGDDSEAKPSADCWRLDSSSSMKWKKDVSLPYPLAHCGVLAVDGELMLIGGTSDWVDNMHAELWRRHPKETSWRKVSSIPDGGRIMFASVVHNGCVFIFGGLSDSGCKDDKNIPHTSSAWVYDPNAEKWTRLPDMPVSAYGSCAVQFGNGILLIGGHGQVIAESGGVRFLDECYFYDPDARTYQLYGHLPEGLLSHAAVSDGTTVWVIGGEDFPRHRSAKVLMTEARWYVGQK